MVNDYPDGSLLIGRKGEIEITLEHEIGLGWYTYVRKEGKVIRDNLSDNLEAAFRGCEMEYGLSRDLFIEPKGTNGVQPKVGEPKGTGHLDSKVD